MFGRFLPPPPPAINSSSDQLARWGGEVGAAGARSQFFGAILNIIIILATLVVVVLALITLTSTNNQLKILNDQYKALLAAIKPFFILDGVMKICCNNPNKSEYSLKIINGSNNPATDVYVNFIVLMKGETAFEDLVSVLVKDFDPKQDKNLGNNEIAEQLNNSLKKKYVKALTEKDAITSIQAYCVYKDRLNNEYNDRDLKKAVKIKLIYDETQ